MRSRGDKLLGGYWYFVGQFIAGYLLLGCAVLLLLLLVDAVCPGANVYGRVRDLLRLIAP